MFNFRFRIFAADNISNPNNAGGLPNESGFESDLTTGDQITWLGGGTSTLVEVTDTNDRFTESGSSADEQTLTNPVTFEGTTYPAGTLVRPDYGIEFLGSDGETYSLFSFSFGPEESNAVVDAILWDGDIPPPGTVLTFVSDSSQPTIARSPTYTNFAICFAAGTQIRTNSGQRSVENLSVGTHLPTQDGASMPIRWIGQRRIERDELDAFPNLRPVRIKAGALGNGLPVRDLLVSRQHRILIQSKIAERMFGVPEVLMPAIRLTELPGIDIDDTAQSITYFHILLDHHAALFAEDAPAESLLLGTKALETLGPDAIADIKALFPDVVARASTLEPAYPLPASSRQKTLIARHKKNRQPLCHGVERQITRAPLKCAA